ncbi:MAG: ribulose-phosphate 3-epimerase [Actinomycetota bacterium]|nr:ribulose-phosphate 3-epimerase [Actinomycetota bacterium]
MKLAPSILSADFGRLAEQLREVEAAGARLVHVDVMDGHFVPNITIGPVVVAGVKKYTTLPLDVHLMIENPEKYIDAFAGAGADIITVHTEAVTEFYSVLKRIRATGALAGLAINPETPAGALEDVLTELDMVTVMSVNPGFGGQTFIPGSIEKIAAVRRMVDRLAPVVEIEVDGGITIENASSVIDAGADILVAGAAVFGSGDVSSAIARFLAVSAQGD